MIRFISIVLIALVLHGCGAPAKIAKDRFYRLTVPETPAPGVVAFDGVLVVEEVIADGLLNERPIVYSRASAPVELFQYNRHLWADPPPRLLQALTVEALRRHGIARVVTTPRLGVSGDWSLVAKVKRFELVFGTPSRVAVSMEFALLGADARRTPLITSLAVEREMENDSVGAATRAMSEALAEIHRRLAAAIRGAE